MNNNSGALSFDATIANSQFNSQIEDMQRRILGLTKTAENEARRLDSTFANLGRLAAGAFAIGSLGQLPGQIVQVRGEFQQLEIAFNTMLRSKAKADQLMADVVQLAAETPFGLKDAAQATKQLLAYGSASESVISELKMLGDVAAGVSVPIGDLTYLYGTLRSQGRAYAVDIRQFAGRGIPIYRELAEVLGVGVDKVNELVEQGKVGFPQVEKAFQNMTGEGGMFFNLMEKQSKSLTGLLSQLKDAIDVMFNNIGASQEEAIASVIKGTISLTQNYQRVADVLTVLIATYGAYKAAVLTVNATRAVELTTAAAVAANVDRQSGSYAREVALKVKSAEATKARTAALAEEAFGQSLNAAAAVQSLRTEVSVAAAKKASAIESAKVAAADIASAEARLAAAVAHQAATSQYLNAAVRSAAAKEVEAAQNALLQASETGLAARKAASAASADFNAKKLALETAAKEANTLVTRTNATAAVASAAAANASSIASTRLTAIQGLQIAVTRQLAAAQAAFNATLLANPIVLTTTALVALAGAVWYLSDGTTAAELAQRSLNEQQERDNKTKEELVSNTSKLTSVINDQNATTFQQIQAYRQLQQLYPTVLGNLSLQEFQTLKAEEAQRKLNAAMDQMNIAGTQSQFDQTQDKIEKLSRQLEDLQKQQQMTGPGGAGLTVTIEETRKKLEAARIEAQKLGEQIKQNEQDAWEANAAPEELIKHYANLQNQLLQQRKSIEDNIISAQKLGTTAQGLKPFFEQLSLTGLNQQIDQVAGKLNALMGKGTGPVDGGNKAYWQKLKEDAQGKLDDLGVSKKGTKEWDDLAKQIQNADNKLKAYNQTQKKVAEKDKPQPFGSIAYYEQVARKAQEIIDKTPESNVSKISEQTRIKNDAEKKAEDIRKKYATKSFEEELDLKRSQYEQFERWATHYTLESAKIQFGGLVRENETYLDYLNQEIAKLEAKKDNGVLNKTDASALDILNSEKNRVTGKESGLEVFKKQLDDATDDAESLTDAIGRLKQAQSEIGSINFGENFEKQKEVTERILGLEKQRKEQLKNFLQEVVGSNQKRIEIERFYNDMLIELDKKYADKSSAEYVQGKSAIQKAKEKELRDQKVALLEESEAYKDLEKVIMETGIRAIEDKINRTRRAMVATQQSLGVESEEYKRLAKQLKDLGVELNQAKAQNFREIVSLAGDLGQALSEANGALGSFGNLLAGAASSAQGLSVVFDDTATKGDKMMAGAQAAVQLIGLVINAAKQRREAEQQFYQDVIGQQMQYNLLLNEQIGLQSEINSNVFTNDYQGRLTDGLAQLKDATEKYQEAIDALNEGLVKQGQRDKVDWGAVGKGAATGAVLGASIGSVIPVIGNAVGAVVGGIVGGVIGLFGGKKKKDQFVGLLAEYPELIQMGADGQERLNTELAKSLIQNNMLDDKTKQLVQNALDWSDAIEKARDQIKGVVSDLAGALGDDLRNSLVTAFKDGTDSAEAFGSSVEKILDDILSKLIFNAVFKDALDQLEKELIASSDVGGDGSWIDDLGRFFAKQKELNDQFNKGLEDAQAEAEKYGLDLFSPSKDNQQATPTPQQGAITGASQEAINILNGQFNAVRIQVADGVNVARSQLLELSAIRANTGATAVEAAAMRRVLENIDKVLSSDWMRAMGG